jgi:hypothetical protein
MLTNVSTTEEEITFVIRIVGGIITEIIILLDLLVILVILENIIVSMVWGIMTLKIIMVLVSGMDLVTPLKFVKSARVTLHNYVPKDHPLGKLLLLDLLCSVRFA